MVLSKGSGLTLSITTTFVVVLAGSLALSFFVTIVFWQRSLVYAEKERVQMLAHVYESRIVTLLDKGTKLDASLLKKIMDEGNLGADGLLIYDGQEVIQYPDNFVGKEAVQQVRVCGLGQEEKMVSHGSLWSLIALSGKTLLYAKPADLVGVRGASLAVVVRLNSIYDEFGKEIRIVGIYVLINIVVFAVIGVSRMVSMIVKPIKRMSKVSESYALSGEANFFDGDAGSEFGRLSMALNSMLMRIELDQRELRQTISSLADANEELRRTQEEMVKAEKLAVVGRLSAGLAHEIGNPLGIVQGYVELLGQPDLSDDERAQFSMRTVSELGRIDRLIRRLLDFTRTRARPHETFDLGALLKEIGDMFSAQVRKAGIVLTVKDNVNVKVSGDRDGVKQVLLNCLLNSIDAILEKSMTAESGIIDVTVGVTRKNDDSEWVSIIVSDNGIGVPQEAEELFFEPFYTTKQAGKGTGLGLSVSLAIIEGLGGQIRLAAGKNGGAVVTIDLPARMN